MESFSLTDTGTETLDGDESGPESWSLVGETDDFKIQDSFTNGNNVWGSWSVQWVSTDSYSDTDSDSVSNGYSIEDSGEDSLSGTASDSSDSYSLTNQFIGLDDRE